MARIRFGYDEGYNGLVQFRINGLDSLELNQKVKVIAWDTASSIDDSNFIDVDYTNDGSGFPYAVFTSEADGLYVSLTQIPEPAEWAGIFGVIALGFALYRRRK